MRPRAAAASVLGRIGDAAAVPALCAASKDAEGSVRVRAIEALARIGDPSAAPALAVPALVAVLRHPGRESLRAAAIALRQMGDRRAILPLLEALLDAPPELDPYLCAALGAVARREPGPELQEALRRLRCELQNLDGESRESLEEARWQLEAAAAPLRDKPIPAAAPAPSLSSLPLPAAPRAPAAESLPVPAASPVGSPDSTTRPEAPSPSPSSGLPEHLAPGSPGRPPALAAGPAPDEILRRFQSVERKAVRAWTGLRPVRVGDGIVFGRARLAAYAEAAGRLAFPVYLWLGLVVVPLSRSLHSLQAWALTAGLLLPLLPLWIKLASGVRRLFFKIDPMAREVIVYPRLNGRGVRKRKRLPLEQIDYFLGHRWTASNGRRDRICAVLQDGRLEALTDNLDADCRVEVNTRILAVTCGKPAYLLDGRAISDDLIAVCASSSFAVRDRAKLLEAAKRLDGPEED